MNTIAKFDNLFTTPQDAHARFSFDEMVAACFADMIRRSVPGYGQMLAMLPRLFRAHKGDGQALVYDLGSSLGAASFALAQSFAPNEIAICAIDVSEAMNIRARAHLAAYPYHDITVQTADILQVQLQPCDMIVLNLTLQFLAPDMRLSLLQKCYSALKAGGILVLSEKVHLDDDDLNGWVVARYYDFKRDNGYSELEISAKREALEDVLVTDSESVHHERLTTAGFRPLTWFKYLNFISVVGFK